MPSFKIELGKVKKTKRDRSLDVKKKLKKMIRRLLILFLFLSPLLVVGQFNVNAKLAREKYPELFAYFLLKAEQEWKDDYEMIVYEVNKQSNAWKDMILKTSRVSSDRSIFLSALNKWKDLTCVDCISYNAKLFNTAGKAFKSVELDLRLLGVKADWTMVLYEFKKQVAAKEEIEYSKLDEYTKLRGRVYDYTKSQVADGDFSFLELFQEHMDALDWFIDNRKIVMTKWKLFIDLVTENLDSSETLYNTRILQNAAKESTKYPAFYILLDARADWPQILKEFKIKI